MRALTALPILAVLSLTAAATADPAPGTIMKVTPPPSSGPSNETKVCFASYRIQLVRLGELETQLKLNDAQKPLFLAWRKVRTEIARAWPCPPPPTGSDVPTPKRLQNQIDMMALTLKALRKEQASTNALYASLTPEQRELFDRPSKAPGPQAGPAQPEPAPQPKNPD